MKKHISERLLFIIKELGYNFNSFSKAIGLTNNVTIGNIVNKKRSPGAEILEKILLKFDSINARWLITGIGEPFIYKAEDSKDLSHKQRIEQYLKSKNTSKNSFYIKMGLGNGFLDSGKNIGSDKIPLLTKNYPDLNIEWLLTGQGSMVKHQNMAAEPTPIYNIENKNLLTNIMNEIDHLKQQIDDIKRK